MQTRSQARQLSNCDSSQTATMPDGPQVTFIHESANLPNFTGDGSETVHAFIKRIEEECVRRSATSDKEKLSILKSRISFEPSSFAGILFKTDKFETLTTYDSIVNELRDHFSKHSKLGATHSLIKISRGIAKNIRSEINPYLACNAATQLGTDLVDQLDSTDWLEDGKMSRENVKKLVMYIIFSTYMAESSFKLSCDFQFHPDDFILTICKSMAEKNPAIGTETVSVVSETSSRDPSPRRSNSPQARERTSRRYFSPGRRIRSRSQSRSRRITCHRCKLTGHIMSQCKVVLDSGGNNTFNPQSFCSFHQRTGHTLDECRTYKARNDASTQSKNSSGRSNPNPS